MHIVFQTQNNCSILFELLKWLSVTNFIQKRRIFNILLYGHFDIQNSSREVCRTFQSIHYWNKHVKIPLRTTFQCHGWFRIQDSGFQCLPTVGILDFKIASDPVVRSLGSVILLKLAPQNTPIYTISHFLLDVSNFFTDLPNFHKM